MLLFAKSPVSVEKSKNFVKIDSFFRNPLDKQFVLVYTKWDRLSQRDKMLKIE